MPDLSSSGASAEFHRLSDKLAHSAALIVLDVGEDASENLAITAFRPGESLAAVGQNLTADVEVRNFGRQAPGRQLIELYVDGERAAEQYVDVGPQEHRAATFNFRFESGGDHAIEARLAADALDLDNHRWLALPVKDTVRVLCVNGKPGGSGLRDTTDYLVVALAPGADTGESLVRPEVVAESSLLERDLEQYDCIFLCNVAQFTAAEAHVLNNYLKAGGGLVFFLGDQVHADSYNRYLGGGSSGGVRLLPAKIGAVSADGQYHFDPLGVRAFARLRVSRSGTIGPCNHAGLQISCDLGLPEKSQAKVAALAFDNGDPAIVEEPVRAGPRDGRGHHGRCLVDDHANVVELPVPVVQELLAQAVSGQITEHNVSVGQNLAGELRSTGDVEVTIETPAGESDVVRRAPGERAWAFAETQSSGVYTAEFNTPDEPSELFAVNVQTSECDLTPN